MAEAPDRDEAAVARFVEGIAGALVDSGWQRMPARVFMTLVASDAPAMTAAELAERLMVSPAAISGAVGYLRQLDMIVREREPGTRRDIFRVRPDMWVHMVERQMDRMMKWSDQLAAGLAVVGRDTMAAERLTSTVEFFDFVRDELPAAMRRWRESHA